MVDRGEGGLGEGGFRRFGRPDLFITCYLNPSYLIKKVLESNNELNIRLLQFF